MHNDVRQCPTSSWAARRSLMASRPLGSARASAAGLHLAIRSGLNLSHTPSPTLGPFWSSQPARLVYRRASVGQASSPQPSMQTITTALGKVQSAWTLYDKDNSGEMSLAECICLLNSQELRECTVSLVNVAPELRTESAVKDLFSKADKDGSGHLNRLEFMALYLALTMQRIKTNPIILAEALIGFVDSDRDGKIDGKELKAMLGMFGIPGPLLMVIPNSAAVEYRTLLANLAGRK